MNINIFDNNDTAYLEWISNNLSGLVVNTFRRKNSGYFFLHKPTCHHITTLKGQQPGGYTERKYIKIASTGLPGLKEWFELNNTSFKGDFSECGTCKPL